MAEIHDYSENPLGEGRHDQVPGDGLEACNCPVVIVSGPGRDAAELRAVLEKCGRGAVPRTAWPEPSRMMLAGADSAGVAIVMARGDGGLGPALTLRAVVDLRKACPNVMIIVLVDPGDQELAIEALIAGAHGCLCRPVDSAAMSAALKLLESGGAPVSLEVVRLVLERLGRGLDPTGIEGAPGGDADAAPIRGLTRSELGVLAMVAAGWTDKRIADRLAVSPRTVQTHNRNIFRKLGVKNRTQAAAMLRAGPRIDPVVLD